MADANGKKFGRTLAVLTEEGIVTFKKFDGSHLKTEEAWVDYFQSLARQVGVPLIVPKCFAHDVKNILKSRGAKKKTIRTRMQKAVCSKWYDDRVYEGEGQDRTANIGDKGYKMKFSAYVLK